VSEAGATAGSPAAGYCRQCGKMLTPETLREVRGAYYCPDCLASAVGQAQPAARSSSGSGRAHKAAALGVIPGLGAIYNGDYWKALIHVLIFGVIISLINRAPGLFVPLLVAWIFYMPFDAYRTAQARETAGPASASDLRRRETIGPILLIVIGTLFLLDQMNLVNLDRVIDFWPLGLIALGVWMLMKRQEQR
jgi:Domain of unknown function (DUF5668)